MALLYEFMHSQIHRKSECQVIFIIAYIDWQKPNQICENTKLEIKWKFTLRQFSFLNTELQPVKYWCCKYIDISLWSYILSCYIRYNI
jgi:hypothetical protein